MIIKNPHVNKKDMIEVMSFLLANLFKMSQLWLAKFVNWSHLAGLKPALEADSNGRHRSGLDRAAVFSCLACSFKRQDSQLRVKRQGSAWQNAERHAGLDAQKG